MAEHPLLATLVFRGDEVSIEQGRLKIKPSSGEQVPPEWMRLNTAKIINEILVVLNREAFLFDGYSTGEYGSKRYSGITLQFSSIPVDKDCYAIFNAEIRRARNSKSGKKGALLPVGRFRVGKKSSFVKFWAQAGLQMPSRLSSFHDRMGRLRGICFTGSFRHAKKLSNDSVVPLQVSAVEIRDTILSQTNKVSLPSVNMQLPNKKHSVLTNRETVGRRAISDARGTSSACESYYGNKLKGSAVLREEAVSISLVAKPAEQTVDEWLADYAK